MLLYRYTTPLVFVVLYPCSVRELVNVVRHLDQYPQDGVALALDNVLSMDTRTLNTQTFPSATC